MSNIKKLMMSAAGGGGLDVEDVFSTYLYTGNGSTQTITNDIDLDGEGGLVWTKDRTGAGNHWLWDTERGATNSLGTNITNANIVRSNGLTAFNSNGFTLGDYGGVNANNYDFASWTFRKAPKFFDVVTFEVTRDASNNLTSTSSNVTITNGDVTVDHNLGVAPAIWTQKCITTTGAWYIRSTISGTVGGYGQLHRTSAWAGVGNWNFPSTTTQVGFGNYGFFASGTHTYIVYLWANNDGDGEFGPNGDQDIIKCGSYTGNGSTNGPEIDLGFEPQWLLTKAASRTSDWTIVDNMRGAATGGFDARLHPQSSEAEAFNADIVDFLADGFQPTNTGTLNNGNGETYIYMAIRRGTKVPESATEVFAPNFYGTSGYVGYLGAPADMSMLGYRNGGSQNAVIRTRMLPNTKGLVTSSAAAEVTTNSSWDNMSGVSPVGTTLTTLISWTWKRAPGFFDVVAYTGTGSSSARAVSHNLGVEPEMMWVKRRDADIGTGWAVYHKGIDATAPQDYYLSLNGAFDRTNSFYRWGDTAPTATNFYIVEDMDASGGTFIAYLFASLPGISKVGSYTGNGTSQTIDCGFTSGARFVLVKCATVGYDWQVFDTERGIVSGNDAKLTLNTTQAEQTNGDFIDPSGSGFAVTSSASMNANGETYIFYAIA